MSERTNVLRGIFDYDAKKERLEEVNAELEQPDVWNEPERAQALGKERASLEAVVETIDQLEQGVEDVDGLLELAVEEQDQETFDEIEPELAELEEKLAQLEFRRMFSGDHDSSDCYIDLQAGSGGTEAQDWTNMMLRMYLRWAEAKGFKAEVIEVSEGEVAGLKSATVRISGDYAYGWLRTETGVHRLVRKSPFDSGGRRHTSLRLRSSTQRLMKTLLSTLTLLICVSTFTVRQVRVVSTSTPLNLRYVLRTYQRILWCSVKTTVLNIRTKIRQ